MALVLDAPALVGHGVTILGGQVRRTAEQLLGRLLAHERDMHGLYAKLGFGPPGDRLMERPG